MQKQRWLIAVSFAALSLAAYGQAQTQDQAQKQ